MHFVLPENVNEGKVFAKFKATSPKKGPSGDIKYAIAGKVATNHFKDTLNYNQHSSGGNVGNSLKIDPNSGEIQISGDGLDYETSKTYEVYIEAQDSDLQPLRSVLRLTIDVTDYNDNPPVPKSPLYNATVNLITKFSKKMLEMFKFLQVMEEESPPLLVTQISATDLDSGDNGRVTFMLLDDFEQTFEIDSSSGEIYTQTKLDRETVANYELTVIVEDQVKICQFLY